MEFFYQFPFAISMAFLVSSTVSLLLVWTKSWHGKFSLDFTQGIQKFHIHPTPRVGGIAIVFGVVMAGRAAALCRLEISPAPGDLVCSVFILRPAMHRPPCDFLLS